MEYYNTDTLQYFNNNARLRNFMLSTLNNIIVDKLTRGEKPDFFIMTPLGLFESNLPNIDESKKMQKKLYQK